MDFTVTNLNLTDGGCELSWESHGAAGKITLFAGHYMVDNGEKFVGSAQNMEEAIWLADASAQA